MDTAKNLIIFYADDLNKSPASFLFIFCKRKINQCIEKPLDLCYPFFISLGL